MPNLVNAIVEEILGKPYKEYGKWFLKVKYNSYGVLDTHTFMFDSKEEAEEIEVGHEFDVMC